MRSHLIPTPVVDKNGRPTTVHKRSAPPQRTAASLASAAPAVAAQSGGTRKNGKTSKVRWSLSNIGGEWNGNRLRKDSFIYRAGLAEEVIESTGAGEASTTVPVALLFDYLRLGISPQEAAALESVSTLHDLRQDELFTAALPGQHGRILRTDGDDQIVPIGDAVDRMEAAGLGPRKAAALLENGLTDDAFGRALDDAEVLDLFSRFKSQPSKVGAETNAAATVNAILDGLIPVRVADKDLGISRASITEVMDALYPSKRASRFRVDDALDDRDRQWILADPDRIVALAAAASSHSDRSGSVGVLQLSVGAIRKHGAAACTVHGVELLCAKRSDGTDFGAEGADEAEKFIAEFRAASGIDMRVRGGHGTYDMPDPGSQYGRRQVTLDFADVLDLRAAGGSIELIAELMAQGHSIPRIKAVIADGIPSVIADGAL